MHEQRTKGRNKLFPALAHRDYRIFWCSQIVSLFGSWMQNVGQSWLVLELTDSPFKLGVVNSAQFLPVMLLSVFVGPLIDRFPKRRILMFTQTALMLLAFALASITALGLASFESIVFLALLLGLVNTLDVPTRQSFVMDLVGREDLVSGVALNSAVFNLARIAGPAVGGLLMANFGIAPCFFANGLSFIAVVAALAFMKENGCSPDKRRADEPGVLAKAAEGLRYVAGNPELARPMLLVAAISTFVINYNVFIPTLAKRELGLAADGFGFLMTSLGVGSFTAAIRLSARSSKPPRDLELFVFSALMSALLAVAGLARSIPFAVVAFAALGFASVSYTASNNAAMQTRAHDKMRGRVMSLYNLVFSGVTPVGALWAGLISDRAGPGTAMAFSGGFGLIAALLFGFSKRSARRRAIASRTAASARG